MVLCGIWRRRRKLCQRGKSFGSFMLTSCGSSTDSCEPSTQASCMQPSSSTYKQPNGWTLFEYKVHQCLDLHPTSQAPDPALNAPMVCMAADRRCACRALI